VALHVGRGVEHVRVQFAVRGPAGKGTVRADAFKGASGAWEWAYMLVGTRDVKVLAASFTPSRPSCLDSQGRDLKTGPPGYALNTLSWTPCGDMGRLTV
jgi:hypothetical protein